ncbi:D-Ala-D-Ala carboxypeptidase family metallohydrolase [Agrobacterium sp. fls2-241-TYG-188a]|uniref:D-Ala-D-Ala carboxypeptidase family metallohydrolase n=1 Tax=Agrobacterium sp. fls2-241-TYG-188a TaxID=3040275 RepID=UPI003305B672
MKLVTRSSSHASARCLAAVFMLALSGCVTAGSDKTLSQAQPAATPAADASAAQVASTDQAPAMARNPNGGYVDPALVSASSRQAAPHASAVPGQPQPPSAYGQEAQISGLVTQPTGISASSLSIYANSQPNAVAIKPDGVPADPAATAGANAYAPAAKISPALNSVYSAPAAGQPRPVLPPEAQTSQQHSMYSSPNSPADAGQALAAQPVKQGQPQPGGGGSVPVAAFVAGAVKKRGAGASTGLTQMAALPLTANRNAAHVGSNGRVSMTDEFDDSDGDKPAGLMKLASLSGLSRVAPNGLLLQTENVNVGCFKPEMIRRIKEVEAHYGRRAMVTSGYRPPKATTQGSKHYTCDAADIQVSGVSKWELASYLRSLPDRGGVGTYCHTESVHMDIGEPRDWNWRCRRTSSSL